MSEEPRVLINALSVAHGGGLSYVTNLIRELERDPRGFRYAVLLPHGAFEDTGGAVERIRVRLPRRPAALRPLARIVYEQLLLPRRARGFDVLYCIADVAPARCATPTVVALRNLNAYDRRYYDTLRLRVIGALARAGLRGARRLVFPSRAAARLVAEHIPIPEERVAVVPHGVSTEVFEGLDEKPAETPYVFLPAVLERHKNIEVLIDALARVRDASLEAWIAGPGTTDPAYARGLRDRVARLGLESRVRFLGLVPYREVFRLYRGARAFVFPSLLETFGHPLLEAMLAGTPIVASDIPASREIAGDAAVFFPPKDADALAAALDGLSQHPEEAQERVDRGRQRVREYTWERSVDRLCEVFDAVVRETRRPGASRR